MTAPTEIRRSEDEYLLAAIKREIIGPLRPWFKDFEEWGQKVRDDIMALEDAVIDLEKTGTGKIGNRPFRRKEGRPPQRYVPTNPGGDPGDPPQDPFGP